MSRALAAMGLLAFAVSLFAGCAPNPKYVTASTGRQGEVKFFYQQRGGHGLIKCNRADDGKLSNCQKIKIILKGE